MSTAAPTWACPPGIARGALMTMDEDHQAFERTRAEGLSSTHALTLAMHVQSIYSQSEGLFIRLLKKRGLRVRRMGD